MGFFLDWREFSFKAATVLGWDISCKSCSLSYIDVIHIHFKKANGLSVSPSASKTNKNHSFDRIQFHSHFLMKLNSFFTFQEKDIWMTLPRLAHNIHIKCVRVQKLKVLQMQIKGHDLWPCRNVHFYIQLFVQSKCNAPMWPVFPKGNKEEKQHEIKIYMYFLFPFPFQAMCDK